MLFFDAFLPLGRSNAAVPTCPRTAGEAAAVMERYDVDRALVFHTVSRDGDPEQGNRALEAALSSGAAHRAGPSSTGRTAPGGAAALEAGALLPVWGYDPAWVAPEAPAAFLERALAAGVRGVLLNPLMRRLDLRRSPRIAELASLLESRRIPLLLAHWQTEPEEDLVDWYELAEFCNSFPRLPVLAWEWRTRSNRPLYDALALASSLKVAVCCLWQAQSIAQVCRSFGAERLVFSLGLPHLDPGSFQACLLYAAVDEGEREAVARGNLERLLEEADYG